MVASIRDITDRKLAEDLRVRLMEAERMAYIGQLAAGLAHEINNPATYIQSNLEVMRMYRSAVATALDDLRRRALAKGQLGWLDELLAERDVLPMIAEMEAMVDDNWGGVRQIVELVGRLREFSRIRPGDLERVDLDELVRGACQLVRGELDPGMQLIRKRGQVPAIYGHRAKLSQVVVNLLRNAAESLSQDGQIDISTAAQDDQVSLTVSDTGTGISADVQERIFEPFYTTKSNRRGAGLGLALCADTVRRHGGTIEVDSTPGQGSRFTIFLPIRSPLAPSGSDPDQSSERALPSTRVLLVDEDALFRESLRELLAVKHEVVTVSSTDEALDQ
ncbi:MAG: ATP-binding protein, partial [Myxococcota bacterium]